MSLLCVTVKKARLQGNIEDFHAYVTLKLQNVKSTTIAVKGTQPQWEQEFVFETDQLDQGLVIELWNKGVLWDKLLGVHFLPLRQIAYAQVPGPGRWLQVDQEFQTLNGETVGTVRPTGHSVCVDCHFELPYGVEPLSSVSQTQSPTSFLALSNPSNAISRERHTLLFDQEVPEARWPLEQLNQHLISLQCGDDGDEHGEEGEISARTIDDELGDGAQLLDASAAARRRAPLNHSGISEDSDYTSDISFPTGFHHTAAAHQQQLLLQQQQQHQANPSVHQFESHLRPHRRHLAPEAHKAQIGPVTAHPGSRQISDVPSSDGPTTSASWQWDEAPFRSRDEHEHQQVANSRQQFYYELGDEQHQQQQQQHMMMEHDDVEQQQQQFYHHHNIGAAGDDHRLFDAAQYGRRRQRRHRAPADGYGTTTDDDDDDDDEDYGGCNPVDEGGEQTNDLHQQFHPRFLQSPPSPAKTFRQSADFNDQEYFEEDEEAVEHAAATTEDEHADDDGDEPKQQYIVDDNFYHGAAGGVGILPLTRNSTQKAPQIEQQHQLLQDNNDAIVPSSDSFIQMMDHFSGTDSPRKRTSLHDSTAASRSGFTDSRSSNSTVVVFSSGGNKIGHHRHNKQLQHNTNDSESDGFTSTGTVVPIGKQHNLLAQQQSSVLYTAAEHRDNKTVAECQGNPQQRWPDTESEFEREKSGGEGSAKLTQEELDLMDYEAKLVAAGRRYDSRALSQNLDGYLSAGGDSIGSSGGAAGPRMQRRPPATAQLLYDSDEHKYAAPFEGPAAASSPKYDVPCTSSATTKFQPQTYNNNNNYEEEDEAEEEAEEEEEEEEEPLSYNSRPMPPGTFAGGGGRSGSLSYAAAHGADEDYGIGYEDPLKVAAVEQHQQQREECFYTTPPASSSFMATAGSSSVHQRDEQGQHNNKNNNNKLEQYTEDEQQEDNNDEDDHDILEQYTQDNNYNDEQQHQLMLIQQEQEDQLGNLPEISRPSVMMVEEKTTMLRRPKISLGATKTMMAGKKSYRHLWKWAYREACKQAGIERPRNRRSTN